MVPRTDEIIRAMAQVLFVVVGVCVISQMAMQAYQGAMRIIGAQLGF